VFRIDTFAFLGKSHDYLTGASLFSLLLAHGAEVNAQSTSNNTPLMYACAGGHESVSAFSSIITSSQFPCRGLCFFPVQISPSRVL
jgi:hypothetical protein